jgi:clan AA aspartic protease (TIGR02281 family)
MGREGENGRGRRQIIHGTSLRETLATSLMGLTLAVGGGSLVSAGPLEDGYAAYEKGDYPAALQLFWQSAAQGNAEAEYNVGFLYESGRGPATDYREAFRWYQLAAAQGNAAAQTHLGFLYQSGRGVSKDEREAIKWFRLAAAQGYAEAKQALTQGQRTPQMRSSATSVAMQSDGGVYAVPVLINGAITLDFVVDSGAADVSIPADVVSTLVRTKTLRESDFIGRQTYVLADGSKVPSQTFRIRSLKVGDRVIEDVTASVASVNSILLLGQSFLGRFKSWSVDNTKHALIFE